MPEFGALYVEERENGGRVRITRRSYAAVCWVKLVAEVMCVAAGAACCKLKVECKATYMHCSM